ncbi:MAG: Lrp/AsnC family transcriptional regulator [Rhodococcus sp. (in: high G+C Gram-positive bacteria)]
MSGETQESAVLDDVDLALINCLQINPRASWRTVGDAIKVDPVTVARRWQRLHASGSAWVSARATGYGRPESCLAFVEVDCTTSRTLAVAEQLSLWPQVLSVEHTSSPGDLTLLVQVRDMAFLSSFLLRSLASVSGIITSRAHLVTEVFAIGDDWKLQVLDAAQRSAMTDRPARYKYAPTDQNQHGKVFDSVDRQLVLRLGADGRSSLAELAAGLAISESTVRRRLGDLTARNQIVFRCDVSFHLSGWPLVTWIWGYVDPTDRSTIRALVERIRGTRVCMRISGGRANILLAIAARSLRDISLTDVQLAHEAPGLVLLNRSVVLRSMKRAGRLLDEQGRSTGVVPINMWGTD